ncbi:MAG: cysteine-rich CWC family protein [Flavobacteriales bacterium]|nr:cysteine-rich CWC family protein [Flavobacteriales bacterium]
MSDDAQEQCARCGGPFVCKPASIHECHCQAVQLDEVQRQHLAERYGTCLCGACLAEVARTNASNPTDGLVK